MRTVVAAVMISLWIPGAALGAQHPALLPEFELIRKIAAHKDADADPETARAAFEEAIADAVVSRLYGTPTMVADEELALEVLAINPASKALVDKLGRVAKGANPFDPAAGGIERALAARCAAEQVEHPDDPASAIEQRRRVEAALGAAREADSLVLVYDCLAWLGLYAVQGGDVTTARRYLSEAADVADRMGHGYARLTARRYLGLTYALESDVAGALRETELAERAVAERAVPDAFLLTLGPALYSDLVDYASRLGDRAKAVEFARRNAAMLESLQAPADERADALERLGQLHARGAAGDAAEARLGAGALASAAELWAGAGKADRAVIDYTGAGVLLVENVGGGEARPVLEKALALVGRSGSASVRAGVEYWLGRAHLAEAAGAGSKQARGAFDRAIAIFESAIARLGAAHETAPELLTPLNFWLGRAYFESPSPDTRAAVTHFRKAFDSALESGDPNTAVTCAELELRALWTRADEAGARRSALELYDRLAASKRIDPVNAARAIASELQRDAVGTKGVAPAVVALYDHAAAALAPKDEKKAANAAAIVALSAADARDRELLAARAGAAFDRLVAAGDKGAAQDLAEAAWGAWDALGDAAEAARWRARFEPLAEASYQAARDAKRPDAALGPAEGLRRAAVARGDGDAAARWARAATDLRRQSAESLEASGKLGLALDAWRALAAVFSSASEHAEARTAYDHAAGLAARIDDRPGRADALAGRARAELDMGDPRAALASASEAIALASSVPVEGPDALPPAAGVAFKRPALVALGVRSAALTALSRAAADAAERSRLEDLARAASALATQLGN